MNELISRQAVEDLIMETDPWWCEGMTRAILEGVKRLPTAQQERTGRWVLFHDNQAEYYELKEYLLCSSCRGRAPYDRGMKEVRSDYCPNCGAYMRLSNEEN